MSGRPRIALVVARAENGAIGLKGDLPWRLRDDLAFFKQATMGKPILMGRRTWESIGRPLPGRRNIVISETLGAAQGAEVARSLDEAMDLVRDASEVAIIGGAQLYAAALPMADVIYLTRVLAEVEGDTFLPGFPPAGWRCVETLGEQRRDERNEHPFVIERYEPLSLKTEV